MSLRQPFLDPLEYALFPYPRGGLDIDGGRAAALFNLLQDRHLPMTPWLATSLAEFEQSTFPANDQYWGRAYQLASSEIGLGGKMGNTPAWRDLFPTFLQAVIEPILRAVALQAGRVVLSTYGTVADPDQQQVMDIAGRKTEDAVDAALTKRDVMGQAFWIGAGVALLAAFRKLPVGRGPMRQGSMAGLPPLPDLRFSQLVYGVEPALEEDRLWQKNTQRTAAKSKRIRVGIRPREGGVTGVLHTRRDSDLGDALTSAFVLPEEIRLIKLLEEGFMITHRPPHRRPDRDLLSMTIQTRQVAGLGAAALAKAAWVDATMRLRILLANLGMSKSEIGYGNMQPTGTIAAALTVDGQQPKGRFHILALKGQLRANSISTSTLVPEIFETIAAPNRHNAEKRSPEIAATQRVRAACAMQAAATLTARRSGPQPKQQMTDYARVCLVEIAPMVVRGNETVVVDWRSDRRNAARTYGIEDVRDAFLGRILCPPDIKEGSTFVLCSDDGLEESKISVPQESESSEAIAKTIGALSGWFITQNILAAAHG